MAKFPLTGKTNYDGSQVFFWGKGSAHLTQDVKTGKFFAHWVTTQLGPFDSHGEAQRAYNSYAKEMKKAYASRYGNECAYPCTVCGMARCNH